MPRESSGSQGASGLVYRILKSRDSGLVLTWLQHDLGQCKTFSLYVIWHVVSSHGVLDAGVSNSRESGYVTTSSIIAIMSTPRALAVFKGLGCRIQSIGLG